MKIQITDIIIPEGRRKIDHDKVTALAESIKIVGGLIHPITIDKDKRLLAGAHRLEACRQLGFDEIECSEFDGGDLYNELVEIDENLIRNELDDVEIGELALRRDEILEELGLRANQTNKGHMGKYAVTSAGDAPVKTPENSSMTEEDDAPEPPKWKKEHDEWETKQKEKKSKSAAPAPLQTTASIAKEAGISERTLQENKQLAKNLIPEAKEARKEKRITKETALVMTRLTPEQQRTILVKSKEGAKIGKDGKIRPAEYKKQTPKKTIAQEPADTDFATRYREWYDIKTRKIPMPSNWQGGTPIPEQNEEGILKIPLPLRYEAIYSAIVAVFRNESEEVKKQVIAEVKELADIIDNLND